ncbi:Os09g0307916 [Oryza sativa Japonica Group]|uniref:Os09g0307916 protein n=1 Tax=Oryza sativa subsp. japonica TaxID=39947 RepID=A0A0P0XLP2_ORYSJ|nr:Os09g0307916 [Oryza sativa Japonica Group]
MAEGRESAEEGGEVRSEQKKRIWGMHGERDGESSVSPATAGRWDCGSGGAARPWERREPSGVAGAAKRRELGGVAGWREQRERERAEVRKPRRLLSSLPVAASPPTPLLRRLIPNQLLSFAASSISCPIEGQVGTISSRAVRRCTSQWREITVAFASINHKLAERGDGDEEGSHGGAVWLVNGVLLHAALVADAQTLVYKYYAQKCPAAESIVFDEVQKAWNAHRSMPASLLRLHFFHDCFVNGGTAG